MTRTIGLALCVLLASAAASEARQAAAQLQPDEVYIVNTVAAAVQFRLRPPGGRWTTKTLGPRGADVYGGSAQIEFDITTDLPGGGQKTVTYTLKGASRYAIYQNGDYYDLYSLAPDEAAEGTHRTVSRLVGRYLCWERLRVA
jgi:hypothetical protein